jgi:inosine-uridine nucleoside N-ribohydrolase
MAIGPLTSLGLVIKERPLLFNQKVKNIFFSGGSLNIINKPIHRYFPKQRPTTASWNTFIDPIAAQRVFNSKIPLIANLSNTHKGLKTTELYQALSKVVSPNRYQRFILHTLAATRKDPFVGDQVTALMWADPGICPLKTFKVKLLSKGWRAGQVILSPKGRLIQSCFGLSRRKFTDVFLKGLEGN